VDSYTQYVYDAGGTRVAKGASASLTCGAPGSNFSLTNQYLVGLGGEQVTELDGWGDWLHTDVWAGGRLLATYDGFGIHFPLTDPLGTKRIQANAYGAVDETCFSLPYGDGLNCIGDDATEHHFTGKERDQESGNDYFSARYYASSMGRFMSPDPLMFNDLRLVNPQRWNMYAYAINSPLVFNDPSGLDAAVVTFATQIPVVGHDGLLSVHPDGNVTFAQFYPKGGAVPYGVGEVGTLSSANGDLPKLDFGSNGYPTGESLSALTDKLSQLRNVSPGAISIAYFKTSSSETAALDQYIANWVAASKSGKLTYFFFGASCATFCQNGMKAAGLPNFHNQLPIPNLLGFDWWWASGQGTNDNLKEKVTHKFCDEKGKNCH
jgi:RHS repeat-associated protein